MLEVDQESGTFLAVNRRESQSVKRCTDQQGVVVHTSNPSTCKTEKGGLVMSSL
jgi:hypothetical protein